MGLSGIRRVVTPAVRAVAGLAITVYVVLLMAPWSFVMPESGQEASWVFALGHAAADGWQWGRDIIFTYGPYSYLATRIYESGLVVPRLVLSTVLAGSLALGMITVLRPLPLAVGLVAAVIMLVSLPFSPDTSLFALPLLLTLLHFRRVPATPLWRLLVLAAACGIAAAIKLTLGVITVILLGLVDLDRLRRRRWPVVTPVMVAAFLGLFVAAGQDPAGFPRFLSLSMEIVNGHSEAMVIVGRLAELAAFVVLALALFAVVLGAEWHRSAEGGRLWTGFCILAACGLYGLIVFKAGFVRQDPHTLTSWSGFALAGVAYAAAVWSTAGDRRWPLAGLGLAVLFSVGSFGMRMLDVPSPILRPLVDAPIEQYHALGRILSDPDGWLNSLEADRRAALERIRKDMPLPALDGTVDSVPSVQSTILAHGLAYKPRTSFLEYTSYTAGLLETNRRFIESDEAPRHIFFAPGSIDERYPALTEGALWPDLLARYEPERFVGAMVLLRRRSAPLQDLLSDGTAGSVRLGESVALPDHQGALFVSLDLRETLAGRLARALFRSPLVTLRVKLADGSEVTHRLIPGIAREGFVLSPYVATANSYARLALGRFGELAPLRVTEMRLEVGALGRMMYAPDVAMRIRPIDPAALDSQPPASEVVAALDAQKAIEQLLASKPPSVSAGHVGLSAEGLFAHAPTHLSTSAVADRLALGFGLRDGTWQNGAATNGVCFRVLVETDGGGERPIWERCLHPVTEPADRGPQTAEVVLPPSSGPVRYAFETDCIGDCRWDWSYWSRVAWSRAKAP